MYILQGRCLVILLTIALCLCMIPHISASSASTNNWAVLVGTSKFWFNYRHMANTLGIYRSVKRLGIPDSNIILMLADDVACNPRNSFPGTVYSSSSRELDLYGEHIEIDYRGSEVTVENFIRLLTGRLDDSYPRSKRLDTDRNSNILVYMTGHGGDEFLKFQDYEEISAFDLADAFAQMNSKDRYNEIFFMIDTCQATTMYSKIYSPNILATGCSGKDESSYSHHNDKDIGVAVIDRYTRYVLRFLEGINKTSTATLQDLFDGYSASEFHSNASVRTDLFDRSPADALITDFFGGVSNAEVTSLDDTDIVSLSNYTSHSNKRKQLSSFKYSRNKSTTPKSIAQEQPPKTTTTTPTSWFNPDLGYKEKAVFALIFLGSLHFIGGLFS